MTIIAALPPAPTRQNPDNFPTLADAFVAALALFVAQANAVAVEIGASATAAAASAVSAVNAPGTFATSATSLTVGDGIQPCVVQTGKSFFPGQWVTLTRTGAVSYWMLGTVSAYDSSTGALSVSVIAHNNAGTFTGWTIAPSSPALLTSATVAQILAGTSSVVAMTPAALIASAAPTAVADAATITLDFATGFNFSLAPLGGNRSLANPANSKVGQSGLIILPQDNNGNRGLAVGSYFKFANGLPSLSIGANALDLISYFVFSPTIILCTLIKGFA